MKTRKISVELTIDADNDADADLLQDELAEDIDGLLKKFCPQHELLGWPRYEHDVHPTEPQSA